MSGIQNMNTLHLQFKTMVLWNALKSHGLFASDDEFANHLLQMEYQKMDTVLKARIRDIWLLSNQPQKENVKREPNTEAIASDTETCESTDIKCENTENDVIGYSSSDYDVMPVLTTFHSSFKPCVVKLEPLTLTPEQHQWLEKRIEPLRCELCNKLFDSVAILEKHKQRCGKALNPDKGHSRRKNRLYIAPLQSAAHRAKVLKGIKAEQVCASCQKVFPNSNQLAKHQRKFVNGRCKTRYSCSSCKMGFSFMFNLQKHLKRYPGGSCFNQCRLCKKWMNSTLTLKKHIKGQKCPVLQQHKQMIGNNGYEASVVAIETGTGDKVQLTSTECCNTGPDVNEVLEYEKRFNKPRKAKRQVDGSTNDSKVRFMCTKCKRTMSSKHTLQGHLQRYHRMDSNRAEFESRRAVQVAYKPRVYSRDKNTQCNLCHKKYTKSCTRFDHIRENHFNLYMFYECTRCLVKFLAQSELLKHYQTCQAEQQTRTLDVHIQEKYGGLMLLHCPRCLKIFNSKGRFNDHVKYAKGSGCAPVKWAKKFSLSHRDRELDYAQISILGEVVFKCSHCGALCEDQKKMAVHVDKAHSLSSESISQQPDVVDGWEMCILCYTPTNKMAEHMIASHVYQRDSHGANLTFKASKLHSKANNSKPLKQGMQCSGCLRTFKTKRKLNWHKARCLVYKQDDKKTIQFSCMLCNALFPSTESHRTHIANCTVILDGQPYRLMDTVIEDDVIADHVTADGETLNNGTAGGHSDVHVQSADVKIDTIIDEVPSSDCNLKKLSGNFGYEANIVAMETGAGANVQVMSTDSGQGGIACCSTEPEVNEVFENEKMFSKPGKAKQPIDGSRNVSKISFLCTKCKRTIHSKQALQGHLRRFHGLDNNRAEVESQKAVEVAYKPRVCDRDKSIQCNLCHKKYIKLCTRFDHMREKHFNLFMFYECTRCLVKFLAQSDLIKHYQTCRAEQQKRTLEVEIQEKYGRLGLHHCPRCLKILNSQGCYNDHVKYARGSGCAPMKWAKMFSLSHSDSELDYTQLSSHGEVVFKCSHCGALCGDQEKMVIHVDKAHSLPSGSTIRDQTSVDGWQVCMLCYTPTDNMEEHLDCHIFYNDSFKCQHCRFRCSTMNAFNKHMDDKHDVQKNEPAMMEDKMEVKVICHVCAAEFYNRVQLAKHLRKHNPVEEHRCQQCGKNFMSKGSLATHATLHSDKRQSYVCTVCGKAFASSGSVKSHMLLHKGSRDFVCKQCGKRFLSRGTRDRHVSTVHLGQGYINKKQYECDICSKNFQTPSMLQQHLNTHKGVKPYHCTVCDRRFTHSRSLRCHKLQVHKEATPYPCFLCERAFTNYAALRMHIGRMHAGEITDEQQKILNEYSIMPPHKVKAIMGPSDLP